MEWKPYLNDRLIAEHESGFFIIKPAEIEPGKPIFCPLCEFIMNGLYDDEIWNKFGCCDSCANEWVYSNMESWREGWRPSKQQVKDKSEKRLFKG